MKYRVIIERDEDGMFVAECPALPGCISQGKTRAEAWRTSRTPSPATWLAYANMMSPSHPRSKRKWWR